MDSQKKNQLKEIQTLTGIPQEVVDKLYAAALDHAQSMDDLEEKIEKVKAVCDLTK